MDADGSNEPIIRSGFRAFSEGRYEDAIESIHPEIEWHIAFRLPDAPPGKEVARGRDEVREIWKLFSSVWERLVFAPEEFIYDEGNQAIVRIHVQGTGGESGVEVDRTIYYLLTTRDEQLLKIQPFDTPAEAAAAGGIELPESPETA